MLKSATILILFASFAPVTLGQATQPSGSYDWSTPTAAMASLERAGDEHDQAALKNAYHAATDEERALLDALDELGTASSELHKACLAKFRRGLPASPVASEPKKKIEAEIRGDEAIVYPAGKQSGLGIKWVRVNGEWKVPMSEILRVHLISDKTLQNAVDRKRRWTNQLRRITREINAGRYASPEEVDKVLGDLAEADDAASTKPTGS
jgi:hypothetical protein